jgi:ATP adenylyltransferase
MDRLWSPWRLPYVSGGAKSERCVFCDAQRDEEAAPLVVFQGTLCFVILNLFPYNNGHLLVVPNRHFASLAETTREELCEMAILLQHAEVALQEAYAPQGLNVGINLGKPAGAGILEHLHIHVVPRWTGDTNYMTVIGQTRVLPEELPATADRLRPLFTRLAAQR